jgi:hypothetical protein
MRAPAQLEETVQHLRAQLAEDEQHHLDVRDETVNRNEQQTVQVRGVMRVHVCQRVVRTGRDSSRQRPRAQAAAARACAGGRRGAQGELGTGASVVCGLCVRVTPNYTVFVELVYASRTRPKR